MSDEIDRTQSASPQGAGNTDPLGVIGWGIGGKYRIDSYIGEGGFGEVYRGHNVNLTDQQLVFKFFKKIQSRDKFKKEAVILSRLVHPNICSVVDFLPDEGVMVVPFIDGKNFDELYQESGHFDEQLLLKAARSLLSALSFAHARQIAHRDIKPSNIMLDRNGHVCLIDFGIAKEVGGKTTKTGYAPRTPQFAAPERQSGTTNYNPFLSDVYEVGVTLFKLATGRMPYGSADAPELKEWGGKAAGKLSPQMKRFLRKSSHPDPERRFQSPDEMLVVLKNINCVYRRSHTLAYTIITLVVVAIAALSYMNRDFAKSKFVDLKEKIGTAFGSADTSYELGVTPTLPDSQLVADTPETDAESISEADPEDKVISRRAPEPLAENKPTELSQSNNKAVEQMPSAHDLRINVTPSSGALLYVGGNLKQIGEPISLKDGGYTVRVVHAEYPLLDRTISLISDSTVHINLLTEFASIAKTELLIGVSPLIDNAVMRVAFNGRSTDHNDMPIFDIERLKGRWLTAFELTSISDEGNQSMRVDSVVTDSYSGSARQVIYGNTGQIDLGLPEWDDFDRLRVVVYWSGSD